MTVCAAWRGSFTVCARVAGVLGSGLRGAGVPGVCVLIVGARKGCDVKVRWQVDVVFAGVHEREEYFGTLDAARAFAAYETAGCRNASEGYGAPDDEGRDWAVSVTQHWRPDEWYEDGMWHCSTHVYDSSGRA